MAEALKGGESVNKQDIIEIVSDKIKLVRVEMGYTQDKMAEIIGLSKKTLVQIEKGRTQAGWTAVIAICALFRESDVIQSSFGGDPLEAVETVARAGAVFKNEKTMGGKVWWKEVSAKYGFVLQQNIISQHYRILDEDNYRLYSTADKLDAVQRYQELVNGMQNKPS